MRRVRTTYEIAKDIRFFFTLFRFVVVYKYYASIAVANMSVAVTVHSY